MYRQAFPLALSAALFSQPLWADGFLDDSKADLTARNFFINNDNRSGTATPSKQQEWGQGFILNYTSGFTDGPVGWGLDALGMLGIRLDSGKGRAYNNGSSGGGIVFPSDSDGRAVADFATLGLTAKARLSNTEVRVGTLQPHLPVIGINDGRLLPQTFQGTQVTSREVDNLTLIGGKITSVKGRNSSNQASLSIAGANSETGQRSNAFYYAGADYKLDPHTTAQYYFANLDDFYNQHFVGLTHSTKLPHGTLQTDLRGFISDGQGENASEAGRLAGYKSSGAVGSNGEVDNRTWSGLFTYTLGSQSLAAGYQRVTGKSDFPFINQGDGNAPYLITSRQIGRFQHAGERTWLAQYSYDFARLGLSGLSASVIYLNGDHVQAASTGGEWERDIALNYVVNQGTFKGLGFSWLNAAFRTEVTGQRSQDENRLIMSYRFSLF